jgi:hypothetical protein
MRPKDLSAEAASVFKVYTWIGCSEATALDLVRQDGLVEESEGDGLARSLGAIFSLSEDAARVAAQGRGSVSEFGRGSRDGYSSGDVFDRARATLNEMSDAEVDSMLIEEQRRRKNPKASPAKSVGSRPAVISEHTGGR